MTLTKKILVYSSSALFSLGLLGAAGCGTPEKQNSNTKTDSVATYDNLKPDTTSKQDLYTCKLCNFSYEDKAWADKCENFCRDSKSCSLEITKHSIDLKKQNE